jgi:hypothetical protein
MKRCLLVVVILLTCFSLSFAQKDDISGIYMDKYNYELHVKGNKLYLILDQHGNIAYYSDTLAICTIDRIEEGLIELNSQDPEELVQSTMKICQEYDSLIVNKKKVVFHIPCQEDILIDIMTDKYKPFKVDYSNYEGTNVVYLPENTCSFSFTLELKRIMMPHSLEGAFYGIVRYTVDKVEFEENKNVMILSFPAIDNSFFERYYVKGDYARIVSDSIIWKGCTFHKCK